jgi:hypothetical protein
MLSKARRLLVLGTFLGLVGGALAQVDLLPASTNYSSIDLRKAKKQEKVWEVVIAGRRTATTLINLQEPAEKPQIVAKFQSGKGAYLFTIEQNFSDIGFTPWWLTFKYSGNKLTLITREWLAAGVNDSGDILLKQQQAPYMDPTSAPYQNVQVMRAIVKGKPYNLGVVERAQLLPDGSIQGFFFEDKSGKRSNGNPQAGTWFKRYFSWKGGRITLKSRVVGSADG